MYFYLFKLLLIDVTSSLFLPWVREPQNYERVNRKPSGEAEKRRSEGAKERRSEGAKERRSEGAKERRSEGAEKRPAEKLEKLFPSSPLLSSVSILEFM